MKKILLKWIFLACALFMFLFGIYRLFYSDGVNSLGVGGQYSDILTDKEREWIEGEGVLVYSADRNAPPLRFVDKSDKQYKGVVVDYINSLSLEIGAKIELHPLLWEDALASLSRGETDICDMFSSEQRAKYYLFTKPIYNLRAVLAVRTDNDNSIRGLADLKGKVIATQRGDYANEYVETHYPDVKMRYVADVYEALELLRLGKVSAVMGDEPVVLYQVDKNNLRNEIKIIDKPLYENEVVFAVPKSKPELVTILNKGIDSLTRKGQLEKIQQKWFGISTPIVTNQIFSRLKNYIIAYVVLLIFILIVMITWNQSLKRQVEARTKELEDSRNDLQIVFDGITEYMIVVDSNNAIANANNAFINYAGYHKDSILNKPCKVYLKEFCGDCGSCLMMETFKTSLDYRKEIYSKSEAYELHTYPLKDSRGFVKNVLILINNITSEKISRNQILQSNKMIAIGQLAAGIAHEIRNPLGIIRNHSFILRHTSCSDEKTAKSLNSIDSAVQRASKIIDNLLNFSRISGNTQELVDIKSFIGNIMELQGKYMQKHDIAFELLCNDDLKCTVNQESLKHILINLFTNAADAINDSGKITVIAKLAEGGLYIECSDTGCGIKKEDQEKIFNPFYTTKDPGKGTGLGLYIVYSEVKRQNGEITVESDLDAGTSFKIFIPLKEGENISESVI